MPINTEQVEEVEGPPVTLGWRLRIALEHAGISVQDMADELEVSRDTIRRWTHDEIKPKRLYIRAWADLTGVSMDFLVEDELRLVRGSQGFYPKASAGDAKAAKTAGKKLVTDNNRYSDKRRGRSRGPVVARRTSLRSSRADNHSYRDNSYCRHHRPTDIAEQCQKYLSGRLDEYCVLRVDHVKAVWRGGEQ